MLRPEHDTEIDYGTAVAYYRYSSDKQDENSVEYQKRAVKEIAERLNLRLVKEYADEEVSGRYECTTKRTQYISMKNDILCKSPRPEYLLCYKLDRIGRSQKEITNCIYDFREKGVKLVTTEMDFSTEMAGAFLGLLANNAENESNKISVRTSDASYEKALKGYFLGGPPPLGYKSVKCKEGNTINFRLEIDGATAPIAVELFERYAYTNCNVKDLCKYLNDKGIPTSRGNMWGTTTMSLLLKKPVYKGTQVYKSQRKDYSKNTYQERPIEIPNILPRLISDELWELVQKKLRDNSKSPTNVKAVTTSDEDRFILTNYIHCGHCGGTMSGISGNKTLADGSKRKYRYYACVNKYTHKTCNKSTIDKEYIEEYVISSILNLISDSNVEDTAQKILSLYTKQYRSRDTRLIKHTQKLQSELDNLIDALADPDIRSIQSIKEKYLKDIARLEKEIEENNEKIRNEEELLSAVPSIEIIQEWLQSIKKSADTITGKQQLIRAFIKSVWLTDDNIIIFYNLGNDPDPVDYGLFKKVLSENGIPSPNRYTPKRRKKSAAHFKGGAKLKAD